MPPQKMCVIREGVRQHPSRPGAVAAATAAAEAEADVRVGAAAVAGEAGHGAASRRRRGSLNSGNRLSVMMKMKMMPSPAATPGLSLLLVLLVVAASSSCLCGNTAEAFSVTGAGARAWAGSAVRSCPAGAASLRRQPTAELSPCFQAATAATPSVGKGSGFTPTASTTRLQATLGLWRQASDSSSSSNRRGAAASRAVRGSAAGAGVALSMVAAGGREVGATAVGAGGGRVDVSGGALKTAVLAVASLVVSVQPAILVLATKAVMKLVASCSIGYYFSKKGILDQNAITSLSKLIFFVFQPCLLFVNVAATLGTPGQTLSKLLVLPAFAVCQILFGSAVGMGMEKLLGLKEGSPEARELRMCTSFANSGPLPLLFVDSIFGAHPDSTIVSSAVAYISFYLLGWSPMFWTAGYTMVAGQPQPSAPISPADAEHYQTLSPFRKAVVSAHRLKASPTFKRIASPPVLGCIAGMFAGLLPAGRALLLGRSAPLSPLFDALKGLGHAYLPAAILVLAGSLARPAATPQPVATGEGEVLAAPVYQPETKVAFYKKVVAIMASRFLVMPLVAAGLLLTGAKAKLIPYDKLVWFVLLMEGCMPSAQNSVVILQMEKKPEQASSMAKTLTAVYLLSAVPIACLLSAILQFVQL
eukprot:g12476.t1